MVDFHYKKSFYVCHESYPENSTFFNNNRLAHIFLQESIIAVISSFLFLPHDDHRYYK